MYRSVDGKAVRPWRALLQMLSAPGDDDDDDDDDASLELLSF